MTRRLVVILIPLACSALITLAAGLVRSKLVPAGSPLVLPDTIGIWQLSENIVFEKRMIDILATSDVVGKVYRNPSGQEIEIIVVRAVNNRGAFHPPEYCMVGTGAEILGKQPRFFDLADGSLLEYNEMLFSFSSTRKMLVANWYYAGDYRTGNFYSQQWRIVVDQIAHGYGSGAVVNMYANVDSQDEDAVVARGSMQEFITAVLPYVRTIQ